LYLNVSAGIRDVLRVSRPNELNPEALSLIPTEHNNCLTNPGGLGERETERGGDREDRQRNCGTAEPRSHPAELRVPFRSAFGGLNAAPSRYRPSCVAAATPASIERAEATRGASILQPRRCKRSHYATPECTFGRARSQSNEGAGLQAAVTTPGQPPPPPSTLSLARGGIDDRWKNLRRDFVDPFSSSSAMMEESHQRLKVTRDPEAILVRLRISRRLLYKIAGAFSIAPRRSCKYLFDCRFR